MDATVFIGAVVAGVTELIRYLSPQVKGALTIAVAVLVGILVALIDTQIGIKDITIAQGVSIGLATAGVVATAKRVG